MCLRGDLGRIIPGMSGGAVPPSRRQVSGSLANAPISEEQNRRLISVLSTSPHGKHCSLNLSQGRRLLQTQSQTQSHTSSKSETAASNQTPANSRSREMEELNLNLQSEKDRRNQALNDLREEKHKFERSMRQQTQLEEELVFKDAIIEGLSIELRLLKQKKQSVDSELAQSTADYMNSQAKWVEQIDSLNDEVQVLKSKLARSQAELSSVNSALAAHNQNAASKKSAEFKQKATQSNTLHIAVEDLSKRQDGLYIKELQACHNRLKDEIREIKEVNERLREDNEHYQYLVIEKTVQRNIALGHRESSSSSQNDITNDSPDGSSTIDVIATSAEMQVMSLADDEAIDAVSGADTATDFNSVSSFESSEGLQKIINKQNFELKSLQNHNNALRLTLERLVDRLLDNKTFSKAVEDSVSHVSVQRFRSRVASYPDQPSGAFFEAVDAKKDGEPESTSRLSTVLSKMIFNTQYTGSPHRRVFSLGVDNEMRPLPPLPFNSLLRPEGPRRGTSGNIRLSPITITFCPKSTSSSNSSTTENSLNFGDDLRAPARTDGLTGVRKLRLS